MKKAQKKQSNIEKNTGDNGKVLKKNMQKQLKRQESTNIL